MDMIAKAAVTAGICGSMVYFLVPRGQEYVSVNQGLVGQCLGTAWMPLAGAGAGALMSVTSDVLHQAILSHIHTSEKWSNTAGSALGALTAAGGSYAGFRAMDPRLPSVRAGARGRAHAHHGHRRRLGDLRADGVSQLH